MGLLKFFRKVDNTPQPAPVTPKPVGVAPPPKPPETEIRPQFLNDFTGQPIVSAQLMIAIKAAKMRGESLRHCLFYGPPGTGKTTLAHIIANEMHSRIHVITGPTMTSPKSVLPLVMNIKANDVLFIDEIHRLKMPIEEALYPIMEDFKLDMQERNGGVTYVYNRKLPKFTLVGATTRLGDLSKPLRERFGQICEFQLYSVDELTKIVNRTASIFKMEIHPDAAIMIAQRSRGTPRVANKLFFIARDFAQAAGKESITVEIVKQSLELEGVDENGLTRLDYRYLRALLQNGGMAGVDALAANINETAQTIVDVIEPHLLHEGYIARTRSGRKATDRAKELMGIAPEVNKFTLRMP